jgi:hypothetical protein
MMNHLKAAAIAAILGGVLSSYANAEVPLPATEIWASISFGGLLSGFQKDLPDQTLSPTPDGYTAIVPFVGVRHYFIDAAGIEASFVVLGSTTANSSQASNGLKMYDYQAVNLGLILRHAFRDPNGKVSLAIFAGGGANYSFLTLSSDYTSLFSGISFYKVVSDIGWYAKAGIASYQFSSFFLDATAYYYFINAKFDVSGQKLDGGYFLVAFSIGVPV